MSNTTNRFRYGFPTWLNICDFPIIADLWPVAKKPATIQKLWSWQVPLEHVCDGYQEQWDNCPGGLPVNMPAQSPEKSTLVDQWYWDVMGNSKPIATVNLPINYGKKNRCYTAILKLHQFQIVSQQPFRGFFFPGCCRFGEVRTLRARNWVADRTKHQPMIFAIPRKDHGPWLQFVVHSRLIFGVCLKFSMWEISWFFPGIFPQGFFPENVSVPLVPRPKDCILGSWSQWQLQGGCTGLKLRHREVEASPKNIQYP